MVSAPTENGKKALTMAEYINRETAIKSLLNDSLEQVGYSREDAADCVRYMDAADVATVRHGRWGNYEPYSDGYRCSCCKLIHRTCTTYCPNCGAKMDLEG